MKIKIYPRVRSSLTDDEYKYLMLLEFHDRFEVEVDRIRNTLKINVGEENIDDTLLNKNIAKLMTKLSIPFCLFSSIRDLVYRGEVMSATPSVTIVGIGQQEHRKLLYNKHLKPPSIRRGEMVRTDSWYDSNKKTLQSSKSIIPALPLIQINKRLNISTLIESIEKNWPLIAKSMSDFEKTNPFPTELGEIGTSILEENIDTHRWKGVKTSTKLGEEFNISPDGVRQRWRAMRNLLKRIGFLSTGVSVK